ncbi:TM1266 family iron-only hydrogenase system putative regulator [Pseudodesulfovibrio sp. zrk46]|uniref:TM1266 family iron-only hydrogenase system putative regulator n=1 Tax=Pseudodesulfovibrio sp. zrk46 TaxID=2725288 RepID=UPI001449CDDB|nr:TM1266 family iron-only hydrogenase system putative regulator [Pseudodesulfovibrio sp. zrk46]QJB57553.1 CopG family transcriptional regulator [Pseudodesulfovibrio sp. zrk46]
MDKRLGIIGIFIQDRNESAPAVNKILGENSDIVVGRMGIPFREKEVNCISLIIEATTDELGAMTGKLGMLNGVKVKSLLA